jgi:hypothetical protein
MTFDEWRDTHWKWGSSTDEAKALRAWNSAREDQEAEIERLKEENAHFAWRDKDKNKLITKLANALELPFEEWTDQSGLIQQAREATKDE